MENAMFKNRKANAEKLCDFGFSEHVGVYQYSTVLMGGKLQMTVTVSANGTVSGKVTDLETDEEYVLHRIASASGAFVGRVKQEYEAILRHISEECFEPNVFKSEYSKAVIEYVRDTYGDELEFLWKKFPDNAIFRRKDKKKWYAALLTVSKRKLGLDSDESIEILDLRMENEKIIDHKKYFPGYHMNKKHWCTVCMDGSVPLAEIFQKIDESYNLAIK